MVSFSISEASMTRNSADIDKAVAKVRQLVEREGGVQERRYFAHESRYMRNIHRIVELAPPGAFLLDVGSHYLHQSAILSELGYRIAGMDVEEFAGSDPVKRRARDFKIENHVVDRLDRGEFLDGYENQFDLVLFSEIQEHITFNPVRFWRRIYHLLRLGGVIYLTTPNSLTPWKMASTLKKLVLFRGQGISVEEIIGTVTFGHHWKEYSSDEIKRLFRSLSPDFSVSITTFQQKPFERWVSLKSAVRDCVRRASARVPAFREELEAVIRLNNRTAWRADPPGYF